MKKLGTILLTLMVLLGTLPLAPVTARAEVLVEEEPIVIVLDPGHGGHDSGAVRTWSGRRYTEKALNLTIARYCQQELEQYAGVEVYLTRTNDTYVSLTGRVAFAAQVDADLFVSLHNNAGTKTSSRGACVYYPNMNYRKELGEKGRNVSLCIQQRLASLGLKNNGIAFRSSENRTRYPDKKLADYYSVIRQSKERGIPGIIVEHAYVSNPSDCRMFFSSNAKLKKLALADAAGIADYYGLVKGADTELLAAETQPDGSVALEWVAADGMDGYSVYRRMSGEPEFERIADIDGEKNTSYTDDSETEAGTYEYCVRAYVTNQDVRRYTACSDIMEAVRIYEPFLLTCERNVEGNMELSWSAVDGADGYVIARRENSQESFLVIEELEGEELEWTDESALEEIEYEYQVCAYIDSENGKILGPYSANSM